MATSRLGPDAATLATLGPRQLELAESRYHALLAAVGHKYHIARKPSEPGGLHEVSFSAYGDRWLKTFEADMSDPRRGMQQCVQSSSFAGAIGYR